MKLSSEELKKLYQQQTARSERPDAECPSAEQLLKAATGALSQVERERVVDHMISCSDCVQEYRLIVSDRASSDLSASASPARPEAGLRNPFAKPRWRAVALAAMLLIAVGTPFILWLATRPADNSADGMRGGRSLLISVEPPDGSALDEAPGRLSWSEVESAESYQVVLYDFQSTPVWEPEPTRETSIIIPESVRQKLARGQPIYWRVIALRGLDRRRSELFQFIIRAQ